MNAREAALKTLVRIDTEQAFSNLTINSFLKRNQLSTKEKNLYITLVYGTLQHLISIDYILRKFIKNINEVQDNILWILRIAIFQILFLDKIPDYAIVNEAVNQAKKVNKSQSKLVNGVLRNVLRKKEDLIEDIRNNRNLSIRYSIPDWIIDKFKATFPNTYKEVLDKVNESPNIIIRVAPKNFTKIFEIMDLSGAEPEKIKDSNELIIINKPSVFTDGITETELYKRGLYSIQDKGAVEIGNALNVSTNESVYDMCAAPGGKTLQIAEKLNNTGKVLAGDVYDSRLKLIKKNAQRKGLNNIITVKEDATVYNSKFKEKFDKVLADVPCSGLGILRRKPEIRYNTQEDLNSLIDIQKKIIDNGFRYLKKGGKLVYSTCTVNPDENENIVKYLIDKYGDKVNLIKETNTSYLNQSDCFYYAVLEKLNE